MEIRGIITTTVLILALITISTTTAAATTCTCGDTCDICVNTTGWWNCGGTFNANGTPIQAAVDNANSGDTICVAAGSYTENVKITTSHLTLEGAGADDVTVTAPPGADHVFNVTADYVNISGFTATGAPNYPYAGIHLSSADNCNISENNCSYNNYYGILVKYSSNNALASNNCSYNGIGIRLYSSSNNTLASNTASSNSNVGIYLRPSSNYNTLASNTANSNSYTGIILQSSSNNALESNAASSNNWGIVLDISSNYNTLTSNTASSNNWDGIVLYSSSNYNTLTSNTARSNGDWGIVLHSSSNYNTLTSNTASSNGGYGIYLNSSSGNLIYNNYFNNTNNAFDDGTNQWNITKTSGTNIIGGSYLGGNYWSDYAGADTDWDGLGDTMLPYNSYGNIQNGGDWHPLVDTTPPVITITTPVPYGLYTVGMTLDFSATDDESGVATIVGNLTNTSEVSQNVSSGFAPPVGVYTLVVTATDNASNTNVSDPVFFVVYDPDGGHATGGGWSYPDENSTLPGGRANFGFTAKYKDASSTGNLNFQYSDAGIHLKSTSIDWLTISSVSAQFQGTGTINGDGLYTFRVKAKDNGEPGAGTDHFDIKIWNGTDTEADPYHTTKNTISGGDIEVHTN